MTGAIPALKSGAHDMHGLATRERVQGGDMGSTKTPVPGPSAPSLLPSSPLTRPWMAQVSQENQPSSLARL